MRWKPHNYAYAPGVGKATAAFAAVTTGIESVTMPDYHIHHAGRKIVCVWTVVRSIQHACVILWPCCRQLSAPRAAGHLVARNYKLVGRR